MSRIDALAAEIHADLSAKRRAEREAQRKEAILTQKSREYVRQRKAKEAEQARQARTQRLIDEALAEAAQKAAKDTQSVADAEPSATAEKAVAVALDGPQAKLRGRLSRYPNFGESGVDLREAADILGVAERDVSAKMESGELQPFVHVSEWRTYDERGVMQPPEQTVYPHLISLESLRAHIDS